MDQEILASYYLWAEQPWSKRLMQKAKRIAPIKVIHINYYSIYHTPHQNPG